MHPESRQTTSDGAPIRVDASQRFRFLPDGVLDQAGNTVELGIVRPKSMADLARVGDASWVAFPAAKGSDVASATADAPHLVFGDQAFASIRAEHTLIACLHEAAS